MSRSNPLSSRCVATAKSTGEPCKVWVIGSGVCRTHGQSKKVRAAQQARAAVMAAELETAKKGLPYERRHPLEVLWDALLGADVILQLLLRKQAAGELTADESMALSFAIDRAARTSKIAIDANLETRWVAAQEGLARDHAGKLIAVMDRCMADPRVIVSCDPRLVVADAIADLGLGANNKPTELRALPA